MKTLSDMQKVLDLSDYEYGAADEDGKFWLYLTLPTISASFHYWTTDNINSSIFIAKIDLQGRGWRTTLLTKTKQWSEGELFLYRDMKISPWNVGKYKKEAPEGAQNKPDNWAFAISFKGNEHKTLEVTED